jgi:hypothetical protein
VQAPSPLRKLMAAITASLLTPLHKVRPLALCTFAFKDCSRCAPALYCDNLSSTSTCVMRGELHTAPQLRQQQRLR